MSEKRKRIIRLLHEHYPEVFAQIAECNNLTEDAARKLTIGMDEKLWWSCPLGDCDTVHLWQAMVKKRTSGQGCPFCSGRRVCKCKSLETKNPELALQLCDERNGGVTGCMVSCSSDRQLSWECFATCCDTRHIWLSNVANRTNGNGCAFCSGRKTCRCRSLAFINKFPEIAATFHPTLNGSTDLHALAPSCHTPFWWSVAVSTVEKKSTGRLRPTTGSRR